MKRLTLEDMREWAVEKGGKCLGKEYWDRDTDMTWRCEKGHVFDMRPRFVQRGAWCPQCTMHDQKSISLDLMQEWAEQRGGKCLSKHYVDSQTKLAWECKNGHGFKMSRDVVKQQKNWCHQCRVEEDRNKRLLEIKKIAKQKGGACLSNTYKNLDTKVAMVCKEGHKWSPTPLDIIYSNSWCPHCYGKIRFTIGYMQKLAGKRGGTCLSKTYVDSKTKLTWKCEKGHVWRTPAGNIIDGTWCPKCHFIRVTTTDIVTQWTKKRRVVPGPKVLKMTVSK